MVRLLNEIAAAGAESMMQARPRLVAVDPPSDAGRRWAIMGLYVAVFSLFGGVIWYAYQETMGATGEPPLIRAEAAPYKRAPDTPGGVDIENENSTLASRAFGNSREPPGMERILPRESSTPRRIEGLDAVTTTAANGTTAQAGTVTALATDVPRPTTTITPAPGLVSEAQAALAQPPIEPAAGPAANRATRPTTPATPAARTDQETLDKLRADHAAVAPTTPARPAAGTPAERPVPQVVAGLPPSFTDRAKVPGVEQVPTTTARSQTEPTTTTPAPVAPARAATTTVPPPTAAPTTSAPTRTAAIDPATAATTGRVPPIEPAAAPPTAGVSPQGQWALQFAALSSPDAGNRAWEQLRTKFPELFNQLTRKVTPVTTANGATLYRLQGAGFDDRNAAARACAALKAGGTDCLVVAASR